MPMGRLTKGVFNPDEIEILSRVFAATSASNETEEQKEHRASRIIANYMAGITDERELIELSRKRWADSSPVVI